MCSTIWTPRGGTATSSGLCRAASNMSSHAAPIRNLAFSDYDLVVCSFPTIVTALRAKGCRADYFFPAYDPELAPFAARQDRPVDVLFVGGYTRHHRHRAEILEAV